VVTTGATCIACSKELVKAGDVKISILSLGYAKN
jgi:predicted amidophosphoribosyltransferase